MPVSEIMQAEFERMCAEPTFEAKESSYGPCIYYAKKPTLNEENGTMSIPLRFPIVVAFEYLEQPLPVLERIAAILNEHWTEDDDKVGDENANEGAAG